jgi:cell division protein FtsQ
MTQRLKRSGASARRQASKAQSARKLNAARARTGSLLDAVMALVPLSEAQLQRLFLLFILAVVGACVWLVAVIAGVPAMAEERVAALSGQAGFEVHKVVVRGASHKEERQIYDRVLGAQANRPMTKVDLAAIRADLLQVWWLQDVRVARQLPDTLVIEVVERKPHAVLRVADGDDAGSSHFVLIDATGHPIEAITAAQIRGRMVMAGEGAEQQVAALAHLLEAAPALRPQVAEAQWIGSRRWDLVFKSGQKLELPEGDQLAARALVTFARYDGTYRLLGGPVLVFDARLGDRISFRKPGEGQAVSAFAGAGVGAGTGETVAASPAAAASQAAPEASASPGARRPLGVLAAPALAAGAVLAGEKLMAAKHAEPKHEAAAKATAGKGAVDSNSAAKPKLETKPKGDGKAEAKPHPKPKAEVKPKAKSEPKAKAKLKPKAEAKPKSEAKPKAEAKPKPKPKSATKPKAEAKPKPKPKSATKPKAEAKARPEAHGHTAHRERAA